MRANWALCMDQSERAVKRRSFLTGATHRLKKNLWGLGRTSPSSYSVLIEKHDESWAGSPVTTGCAKFVSFCSAAVLIHRGSYGSTDSSGGRCCHPVSQRHHLAMSRHTSAHRWTHTRAPMQLCQHSGMPGDAKHTASAQSLMFVLHFGLLRSY